MELFRELPPAALDDVIKQARLRRLAKDTRIFEQGSSAGRCHALIDGRVRVAQSGSGGGQVVIRQIMKMTLSVDHRLIDGAQGAQFVNAVKSRLEDLELWKRLTSH